MGLSAQYDKFYKSSQKKEMMRDASFNGWPCDRVQAILFSAGNGKSVLDVGCGNGHLLYQLQYRFDTLIGLEFSPHRLEQAKVNLPDLPFISVLGSAEDMTDIESNSIDCVVSSDTIEHIPDVYAATAEMYRVLRPGGQLVINTPNIAYIKRRLSLVFGKFPSTSQPNEGIGNDILFDGGHLHYFTFRSLSLLLRHSGFKIIRRLGYGRLGRMQNVYPTLLSGGIQLIAQKKLG